MHIFYFLLFTFLHSIYYTADLPFDLGAISKTIPGASNLVPGLDKAAKA